MYIAIFTLYFEKHARHDASKFNVNRIGKDTNTFPFTVHRNTAYPSQSTEKTNTLPSMSIEKRKLFLFTLHKKQHFPVHCPPKKRQTRVFFNVSLFTLSSVLFSLFTLS